MKLILLQQIWKMTKLSFYGLLLQVCLYQFLWAENVSAQKINSVREVHININFKNADLEEVFNYIESRTDFSFSYNIEDLSPKLRISRSERKISVAHLLEDISRAADLKFKQVNKNISVDKIRNANKKERIIEVIIQTQKVSGKVTSFEDDEGLPGVNVVEKGTANGTVTNVQGHYSLEVREGATLVFSSVGYTTEEVEIGNRSVIDMTMNQDIQQLQELVVVGYGVQQKKLVTGATVQISGDEISKLNTVSSIEGMQGQSPGVSITKYSGKPGSDFKINIRGLGTTGNSNPLIIIDNVIGGDLNLINPADIESIDILKDAASTAIYGARAANGVILVTTKQGKKGKPQITFDGFYGMQNIAKYVDMVDAPTYIALQEESHNNIGAPIPDWSTLVPDYNRIQQGWAGTDWQREFTNTNAPIQNHSLNIVGGSDYSTYSLGLSYTDQEGVYGQPVAPRLQRYSVRINSDHILISNGDRDVLTLGENILYNYRDQNSDRFGTDGLNWNDVRWVTRYHPLMPARDDNGDYINFIDWQPDAANPIASYDIIRTDNRSQRHDLRANLFLNLQIIEGLNFKTSLGYNYSANVGRTYVPAYNLGGRANEPIDQIDQSMSSGLGYQWFNTLSYNKQFDNHTFDALLGQSLEESGLGESIFARNRGSIFDSYQYAYLSNVKTLDAANLILNGLPWQERKISSFFGRLNYNFNETYLLSLVMRADGSSNFAKGNRWGYFPSVAGGWIITNEDFMAPLNNFMDYFKVRASWGQNGNESIDPFQYVSTYSFSGGDYYFGPEKDSWEVGAYPSILPNPDVTWETSEQIDIGFDSWFFNSKLGVNFDWYRKTTRDWLIAAPVPATWGATAPFINGGDVQNTGVEFVVTWQDTKGDLSYGINANLAFNKNEVTRIANQEGIIEGSSSEVISTADRTAFYRAEVGKPIGYFYGFKTAGIFKDQQQIDAYEGPTYDNVRPGDVIFVDVNGDGILSSEDKTMIGDPNPDAIFGLSFNVGYKGFDLSVSSYGVAGNQIISSIKQSDSKFDNWPAIYLDRWQSETNTGRYPRLDAAAHPNWGNNSDIYIDNGDFLRIQNLTLGYDFAHAALSNTLLNKLRAYVAVNNLYTFTDYYGADPEVGYAAESWTKGIDVGFYPTPRTVMFGLNLKF